MSKRKMSAVDRAFYRIDRERLWKEQEGKCHYCKKSIKREDATMDHVIPIKNTKYHSTKNCVVSCYDCNQKKGSQETIPLEWWEVHIQEGLKRLDRRVRLAEYRISLYVGTEESKGSFNQWERYHMKRGNKMIKIMKIEPRHYAEQRRMLNSSLSSDEKIIDVFCDIFKEGKYHIVKEYPFDMGLEQLYDHAYTVDDIPINVGDVVRMGDTYNVCLPFGWKTLTYEEIFTR